MNTPVGWMKFGARVLAFLVLSACGGGGSQAKYRKNKPPSFLKPTYPTTPRGR